MLTRFMILILEHDEQERCMKPFLSGCDTNRDSSVSRGEWCRCFQKADRPCTAVTRRATRNHFIGLFSFIFIIIDSRLCNMT